jgi:tetratricopeptide (TPR) repeat protein
VRPDYAEALYNRGVTLQELKRFDEALASYDRALVVRPDFAQALRNRGLTLQELKRFDEALASYDRALALRPDDAEALNNRGNTLKELKRSDEALASYDRALAVQPDYTQAFYNRGVTLQELKRFDEALASYDRALALRPDFAEALRNRGVTLQELTRFDVALASYDRALALRLDDAEALNNRGIALKELKRFDEALANYDRALAVRPDFAEALNNRGNILKELTRFDEALVSYHRALGVHPDYVDALYNRGNTLQELKQFEEALASYNRAIALKPDYAACRLNRAICKLRLGRYIEGWTDYEWRRDTAFFPSQRPNLAMWNGERLEGLRLLIFSEQGLGDIIQFAGYLPLLALHGCQVTFLTRAKLTRLLKSLTNRIEIVSELGSERTFDFQCALLSLPHRFGTDLKSIPNTVPYLLAEDSLVARWRERIGTHGFKVGISWQGNPAGLVDQGRSVPLTCFQALGRIPGVRLISLQTVRGLKQLAGLPAAMVVEALGDDFDAGPDAFVDCAAVMHSLDLVVTCDTAIGHLAGALGRPVWLALKQVPHWTWMLDRSDSPWYASMRLFRQPTREAWGPVFDEIAAELRKLEQIPVDFTHSLHA